MLGLRTSAAAGPTNPMRTDSPRAGASERTRAHARGGVGGTVMIAHVSLPAMDCATVARVLAEMIGGGALRFPPGGPDAWNCWSRANDFQIVVTPCGQMMVEGPHEQIWV